MAMIALTARFMTTPGFYIRTRAARRDQRLLDLRLDSVYRSVLKMADRANESYKKGWDDALKFIADKFQDLDPIKKFLEMTQNELKKQTERFIYFIQADQAIKIGITENVEARVKSIQTMNPFKLKLLGYHHGDSSDETRIHEMFHKSRLTGEWFRYEDRIISYIKKNCRFDLC